MGVVRMRAGKPFLFECSELSWKMCRDAAGIEIGARQQLREFDLSGPAVQAKMRERYGAHVPLKEPVISPGTMYDSALLETVEPHRVDRR